MRLQQLHYGQVLFQLYQGDHQRSLEAIALAETLGVPEARQSELQLLKGGVSLAYGLTQEAETLYDASNDALTPSDSALQLKARYWLAVTHFHLGRWQQARLPVGIFSQLLQSEMLTEDQKSTLAYQQAYAATLANEETLAYKAALSPGILETQYLEYNQGVNAFAQGDYAEAVKYFQTAQTLLLQPQTSSWSGLGWLGLWGTSSDEDASRQRIEERQALTNQVSYALGQSHMAQQALTQAMESFGQIEQASPLASQALLELGQAHAQAEQWPQAMAIWQYLTGQDHSFAALQAMRALAYGFEVSGDERQAMQSLEEAELALLKAQTDIAHLNRVEISDVLSASSLRAEQPESAAIQWPARHRDLQLAMLSGDNARWLEQLHTLDEQQNRLASRLDTLRQLEQLLAEREQEHTRRAVTIANMDLQGPLVEAERQLAAMKTSFATLTPGQLASAEQAKWLKRLTRAGQTLSAIEALKPDQHPHRARLERLKGILNWQLEEAFLSRRWQHQQSLTEAESVFIEAKQGYQGLLAALSRHRTVDADRNRLLALKSRVSEHLEKTVLLAGRVESELKSNFDVLLAGRQQQLDAQLYHTRLAKLRLQDAGPKLNDGEPPQSLLVQEDVNGH